MLCAAAGAPPPLLAGLQESLTGLNGLSVNKSA